MKPYTYLKIKNIRKFILLFVLTILYCCQGCNENFNETSKIQIKEDLNYKHCLGVTLINNSSINESIRNLEENMNDLYFNSAKEIGLYKSYVKFEIVEGENTKEKAKGFTSGALSLLGEVVNLSGEVN